MQKSEKRRVIATAMTAQLRAIATADQNPTPEDLEALRGDIAEYVLADKPVYAGQQRTLGFFTSLSAPLAVDLRDAAQIVRGQQLGDPGLDAQLIEIIAGCDKRIEISKKQGRPRPETLARRKLAELAQAGAPVPPLADLLAELDEE